MEPTITQEPIERLDADEYSMGQLCEVAFIAGALEGKGEITLPDYDLSEMYTGVYIPILTEWAHGMKDGIFKNEEEEGYISAYAQRRLADLYGCNKEA